jgi:lipopolysaccharide transport system ATP-binding protein
LSLGRSKGRNLKRKIDRLTCSSSELESASPMSDIAVTVENLSKRYLVGHRFSEHVDYTTLRDVISREVRAFARRSVDVVCGRQIVQGDEIDQFWALQDVSFQVKQGDVLGIVGRNGAGKSTLLKILSRITEPDRGRAILRGRVSSLLEVDTGFHPELTGRENIFLNGAILGMQKSEIKRKFDEIVAFSEVERFLDTPVKHYSSGMYVRLAFAIAAHLEPEILVIDEVLAVGDVNFQQKCIAKMQDVASKEGRTILLVSHNMAVVESMCNSAVLLAEGRCVARGGTSDIVREYLRDIDRACAMILVERTDREGSGEVRFVSLSFEDRCGNNVSAFQCGGLATLHLLMENRTNSKLRDLRIALGIDDEMGQRVAVLDTMLTGDNISDLSPGQGSVRVILPRMALTPGRYRVTIFSTINGTIADWIKNAAVFDVVAGDYYGTGQLPPHGKGMFLMDHKFVAGEGQIE